MDLFRQIELLQRLNDFIEKEGTGNPATLSKRLGISRSQLYRIIDFLKDHEVPIRYSRILKTFYYNRPFQIKINFELEDLSQQQVKETNGGEILFRSLFPSNFWDGKYLI